VPELRLKDATVDLSDNALGSIAAQLLENEEFATRVAELLSERDEAETPTWIRGAKAAARYAGCSADRIYDLVGRGDLEHRKDGSRLMFRPQWLDEAFGDGRS
jgi:hypothetical protein